MSSIDFNIVHADESLAEKIAQLYVEGYGGRYPLEEFTDPELVRKAINDDKYCWVVGLDGDRVIASSVGILSDWNNSFEHGRAIVYPPEFRRKNIIQTLISKVISSCLHEGYDIGWLSMRDSKGIRFSEKNSMGLVGFLPGNHKVKKRENQLLYLVLEGNYRTKRVINEKIKKKYGKIIDFVEDQLSLNNFGLGNVYDEYPSEVIAGGIESNILKGMKFEAYYDFEPNDNAVYLGKIFTGVEVMDTVKSLMTYEIFRNADYIQIDVLADKFSAHEDLKQMGFEMCAFLPAWFLKGKQRYDCIRFAKHSSSESIDEEILYRINELKELMSPSEEAHETTSYTRDPLEQAVFSGSAP